MSAVVVIVTAYLWIAGNSFYSLPLEERFYHPDYNWFKPSGLFGQGLGVIGTFMIAFGVAIYIARKNHGFMEKYLRIKYLLEFHIFLCTLGPILILFHTSFKFGGIVSIAFWSMIAIVASGVVGRFIYVQIPRNIQGQALGLEQIHNKQKVMLEGLKEGDVLTEDQLKVLLDSGLKSKKRYNIAKGYLKLSKASRKEKMQVLEILNKEKHLESKIANLSTMKTLFKYWHVIHKPFALIMLFVVLIHIGVTVTMGYTWIF
ncbi:MAG: hypothetical protein COA49_05870 [Bacteroidetes bacterium]|nr:MAG: hypothetical protein COA49_05870 [Bacteroidota bacterium]